MKYWKILFIGSVFLIFAIWLYTQRRHREQAAASHVVTVTAKPASNTLFYAGLFSRCKLK